MYVTIVDTIIKLKYFSQVLHVIMTGQLCHAKVHYKYYYSIKLLHQETM